MADDAQGSKLDKRYVTSVSFDMGLMEVNEEKLKVTATQLFRGRFHKRGTDGSLQKKKKEEEEEEKGRADNFEPDWSAFESAYASGK